MNVRVLFQDYYAFGVQLDGRTHQSSDYRYGYQGSEKDDEVKGSGNSLDFGARMYDPRLGRWLSRDAYSQKKPALTPYQGMRNNPIIYEDSDGNDEYLRIVINDTRTGNQIVIESNQPIRKNIWMAGTVMYSGETRMLPEQVLTDFYTTITFDIGSEELSLPKSNVSRKDYGSTTKKTLLFGWFGSAWAEGAIVDLESKQTQAGGYMLTSKTGGGSTTVIISENDVRSIEIDLLVSALGGLTGGNPATMLQRMKSMVDGADKLNEVIDMVTDATTEETGTEPNQSTGDGKTKNVGEPIYNEQMDRLHLDSKGDTLLFYENEGTVEEPIHRQPTKTIGTYEKRNSYIYISSIFFFLLIIEGCSQVASQGEANHSDIYNKLGIDPSDEIKDKDCIFIMNQLFSRFSGFDFKRVFKIKKTLWKKHYSKDEDSEIVKFIAFSSEDTKGEYMLFGFDNKQADFLFLNYIYDLDILTKDPHFRYFIDLSILGRNDCFKVNLKQDAPSEGIIYQNKTFEHDSTIIYKIDSILSIAESFDFFIEGQVFNVLNNTVLMSDSLILPFYFKDYHLYFINGTDTLSTKMISRSKSHIIIEDELNSLYFISR